jgi:hypothetical protein
MKMPHQWGSWCVQIVNYGVVKYKMTGTVEEDAGGSVLLLCVEFRRAVRS